MNHFTPNGVKAPEGTAGKRGSNLSDGVPNWDDGDDERNKEHRDEESVGPRGAV